MAAPSEEKLICDKFNLEALTVNQVKSFKALADGKDVFYWNQNGKWHLCLHFVDNMCSV
jgi:hypothetical protein